MGPYSPELCGRPHPLNSWDNQGPHGPEGMALWAGYTLLAICLTSQLQANEPAYLVLAIEDYAFISKGLVVISQR